MGSLPEITSSDKISDPLVFYILYRIIASEDLSIDQQEKIRQNIQIFEQTAQPLTKELRLSTLLILRHISISSISFEIASRSALNEENGNSDEFVTRLYTMESQLQITKRQVELILAACIDTNELSKVTQEKMKVRTVQEAVWKLLNQQHFSIETDAFSICKLRLSSRRNSGLKTGI